MISFNLFNISSVLTAENYQQTIGDENQRRKISGNNRLYIG